jgi:hypothetical protein
MIRTTEYFATEVEAHKRGADFVEGWGYGYGATYAVWFSAQRSEQSSSETYGQWTCSMSRYSSCD